MPASYSALQQQVTEEVQLCREKEIPPVLNQKEFAALADSIPDGDILDPEELSLGRRGRVGEGGEMRRGVGMYMIMCRHQQLMLYSPPPPFSLSLSLLFLLTCGT